MASHVTRTALDELARNRVLILDGAMGTMLMDAGLTQGADQAQRGKGDPAHVPRGATTPVVSTIRP